MAKRSLNIKEIMRSEEEIRSAEKDRRKKLESDPLEELKQDIKDIKAMLFWRLLAGSGPPIQTIANS